MSKLNNLAEFLLGIANKIRFYLSLEGKINPQSFEEKIDEIYRAAEGSLQEKEIEPSVDGQTVTPDEGYRGMSKVICSAVTSKIDKNILPENIKEGVAILGVVGTLSESGEGGKDAPSETVYLFPFDTLPTISK